MTLDLDSTAALLAKAVRTGLTKAGAYSSALGREDGWNALSAVSAVMPQPPSLTSIGTYWPGAMNSALVGIELTE